MNKDVKLTFIRFFWLLLGCFSVALGAIGIFVPLMPTTVFLLVAAFAFARSSERFHNWLLTHAIFGPLIKDWIEHKTISVKSKWMSSLSMIGVILITVLLKLPIWVIGVQIAVLSLVALFLITRPSTPRDG